jgi:hypothetical protein
MGLASRRGLSLIISEKMKGRIPMQLFLASFGVFYFIIGAILGWGAYVDTRGAWYKKIPFAFFIMMIWGASILVGDEFLLRIQNKIEDVDDNEFETLSANNVKKMGEKDK